MSKNAHKKINVILCAFPDIDISNYEYDWSKINLLINHVTNLNSTKKYK